MSRSRELIIGQLVGQLALLAAIPFLTRLLPISEMGVYQVGFSIALILQPLATLRSELLIPVSTGGLARRHRSIGLSVSLVSSTLAVALGIPTWIAISAQIGEALIATGLILMSVSLLAVENAFLIRHGELRRLAVRNLSAGVLAGLLQVVVAAAIPSAVAVAAALLVGRGLATAFTIVRISGDHENPSVGGRTSQRSVSAILSAMVATASSQAVVLASFWSLGSAAAAQIGVGQRVASAPTTLIGQALSQASLGAAAPLIRERRVGIVRLLRKQAIRTSSAAAFTTAALMIGGPLLAGPVLGPGWETAGTLTAIFAVPLSLQLVALPATTLMVPLGHERRLLLLQVVRLIGILATLVLASALSGSLVVTCLATSIVWTLLYIPLLIASFRAAREHDRLADGACG